MADRADKIQATLFDDNDNPIETTNPLPVTEVPRTDLEGGGKIAVGTSEVEVSFAGEPTQSIIITADIDNTGKIFIGKTGVGSDGSGSLTFLERGDSIVLHYDDDTNAIYVISDTAGQNFWKGAIL